MKSSVKSQDRDHEIGGSSFKYGRIDGTSSQATTTIHALSPSRNHGAPSHVSLDLVNKMIGVLCVVITVGITGPSNSYIDRGSIRNLGRCQKSTQSPLQSL